MKTNRITLLLPPVVGTIYLLSAVASTSAGAAKGEGDPSPATDDWSSLKTGEEIYRASCAACHGLDGKGQKQSTVGFDIPLPDFTDCSFASREPHADWFAVAHDGGPTRAFDTMMPAFGGAISDEQLERAATHVKDFCRETLWPPGEFNIPRALVTGKAFPEDEFVWEIEGTFEEPVSIQGKFIAEKRLGARNQIEVAIPVGVQQVAYEKADGTEALRWGEGFGDLSLGWKAVLWHCLKGGTIGSLGTEVFFPIGDEADDFSDGIFKFEPFLAIGQLIPGDNFLQLHGGAELSTDTGKSAHEVFWRGAVGHTFTQGRFGRAWSPMVEVTGIRELESGATIDWDVVPQLHITLSQRQHVMLVMGAGIPINDFDERQITGMIALMWDWFDGGFAEGWRE